MTPQIWHMDTAAKQWLRDPFDFLTKHLKAHTMVSLLSSKLLLVNHGLCSFKRDLKATFKSMKNLKLFIRVLTYCFYYNLSLITINSQACILPLFRGYFCRERFSLFRYFCYFRVKKRPKKWLLLKFFLAKSAMKSGRIYSPVDSMWKCKNMQFSKCTMQYVED